MQPRRRPPSTTYARRKNAVTATPTVPVKRQSSPPTTTTTSSSSSPSPPPPPPQKKPFAITRTRHRLPTKPRKKQQQPREKLTQLTLDLGQSIRTTCVLCGMSYHISDPSDISIHRRFHGKFLSGIDFPETSDTNISIVTPSSSSAEQKKVREVLEVVDSELSAAAIPEKNLWAGGYKAFLYVAQGKVVGLLLAERIESAFLARGIGSVELGERRRAVMGVSRVWTAKEWRRMGVARKLLDEACERFVYGMRLGRGEVAFSQPTESGGWLARGWVYGKAEGDGGAREDTAKSSGGGDGWLVYVERE